MITSAQMNQVRRIALATDHDASFGGRSKGNRHLERVTKIAHHLAEQTGAATDIVVAGAWLHDIALPGGNDYDPETNRLAALACLEGVGLSEDDRAAVAQCVASHEGTAVPSTPEAQVVHDADVLEKSGVLGLIRHTWKVIGLGRVAPDAVSPEDVASIVEHVAWRGSQLSTARARALHAHVSTPTNSETQAALIRTTARLAAQGLITEQIADEVKPLLDQVQQRRLAEQISVTYLSIPE